MAGTTVPSQSRKGMGKGLLWTGTSKAWHTSEAGVEHLLGGKPVIVATFELINWAIFY
jgi:hypothetical protein